ncbi:MAG TPA: PfkB family carbohydrate kinase, partial [Acidothermaceae bacterium]
YEIPGTNEAMTGLDISGFKAMISNVVRDYPNIAVAATTLREVHSASVNDWGAIAWSADTDFVESTFRRGLEILDRVGGGDSFASGLAFGLMETGSLRSAIEYGAAHGALAMSTAGDTSTANRAEVEALMRGVGAGVQR